MKLNTIIQGDALEVLKGMPSDFFDSCVTDPPYELGFMGKAWDSSGVAYSVDLWREVLRVLKPGAHLLSFGGSRTYHRMACAIEDAGFEIRDQIMWIYGSGFPKSLDISKAIDKAAGAERDIVGLKSWTGAKMDAGNGVSGLRQVGGHAGEYEGERVCVPITAPSTDAARQWSGWGTALKPAHEPIVVARKPFKGTVAENVLQHGTGGLNIDGGRIETNESTERPSGENIGVYGADDRRGMIRGNNGCGRFPANVIHDSSEEVVRMFPLLHTPGNKFSSPRRDYNSTSYKVGTAGDRADAIRQEGNCGSAARFFYCAKASRQERGPGNNHPTVKPLALIQYLVKLVTPPGGIIIDPFIGSGTLGIAAGKLGMKWVGIEKIKLHIEIAERRIEREVGLLLDMEAAHAD